MQKKYKNLIVFFFSLIFAVLLSQNKSFHQFILGLGNLGYFGAFVAGMFFVSTFTVSIAAIVLIALSQTLTPWEIGIIAGFGAVVGDFTILKFIKDNLLEEVMPIYEKLGGDHIKAVFHTKYFSWTLPVIGAILIASPLPDEIGVSLMGISKMKTYQFLILSFVLNSIGIFLVVSFAALSN